MNSNENNKVQSALIKVEALQKEYEVILQQYKEATKNFNLSLSTNNDNIFKSLKGRTWWGTGNLSQETASTQEECSNMCLNSEECSGATFNPVEKYCWMRKGISSITVGKADDYALIPKQTAELEIMKSLNERLLILNNKIRQELTNIKPEIKEQYDEKTKQQMELDKSYQQLQLQNAEFKEQLSKYYSINQTELEQQLYVNKENATLRLWSLITGFIILVTLFLLMGDSIYMNSIIVKIMLVIILIYLTYLLKTPSGFVFLFLCILIIYMYNK
jgi:hypothetical protein